MDLGRAPVDLGGSWIHNPQGNPLTSWADHLGVERFPGDCGGLAIGYDLGTHQRLTDAELEKVDEWRRQGFAQAVAAERAAGTPDRPASQALADYVAGLDLDPWLRELAAQGARATVEADAGDLAENTSTHWLDAPEPYGGPSLGPKPLGGYRALVAPLAAGLDLREGFEAAVVLLEADRVVVTCVDGREEAGSHVIVAVPLGVLQDGRPAFDPPLPPERRAAVARVGFSSMEKVALAYDEPWWRTSPFGRAVVFPSHRGEAAFSVWDFRPDSPTPVLVATVLASTTGHMVDVPEEDAVAWLSAALSDLFGRAVPEPAAVAVTNWRRDRFALGSYAHIRPGQPLDDPSALAEPVAGRILFAGEHTDKTRLGFADGAMTNGIREAKRLLRLAAVALSAG